VSEPPVIFRGMNQIAVAFYAKATGVDGHKDFSFQNSGYYPDEALKFALVDLPTAWLGNIEIYDDETSAPDEMPLIDFWVEK
jgi:hypothetical protein